MSSEAVSRGSQKLAERLAHKGAAVTAEDLKSAIGASENLDFKLLRWWLRGQPPFPIELAGTLEVKQEAVGQIVQTIINTRELAQGIEIFPYGIPKPDIALVNFTNVPSQAGR
jgi:hypothetical protein